MSSINFSLYFIISFLCNSVPLMLYTISLSTRAMLKVLGKCIVLGEAMQSFVHHQHNGVVKIKYIKELRFRFAKFVYYNHNRVVYECHMSSRHDREPTQDSWEEAETSVAEN